MASADSGTNEMCWYSPKYSTEKIKTYSRRHKKRDSTIHEAVVPSEVINQCYSRIYSAENIKTFSRRHKKRDSMIHETVVPSEVINQQTAGCSQGQDGLPAGHNFLPLKAERTLVIPATRAEKTQMKSQLYDELKLTQSLLAKIEAREQELAQLQIGSASKIVSSDHVVLGQSEDCKQMPESKGGEKPALPWRNELCADKRQGHDINANSLRADLMRRCSTIWETLASHPNSWNFRMPDFEFDLPTRPMDLGTIKTKLENKVYTSPFQFAEDVRLTFAIAMKCYPKEEEVHKMSSALLERFESEWTLLRTQLEQLADSDDHQGEMVSLAAFGNHDPDHESGTPAARDPINRLQNRSSVWDLKS